MRRRVGAPAWRVLLCLAAVVVAMSGWYATRTVRPYCAITISSPPTVGHGYPLPSVATWKRWTAEQRTDAAYWFAVGSGRCESPEPRWHQWIG
ncbi:hypothetical protein [Streptomyces sp. N50]|uniref:hypothetical protein n=1 Tax=Streptomyces sp. N50 TaxID=3081765 RepID=UPI00296211EC|nr:hypothetical protein [Streptomyces sp. N50]WOX17081.1 hypothetical protein R2B38_50880 [Streptomyces sp. N50]